MTYLSIIIFVALAAAFLILMLSKIGFVEYMQVHGSKLISELFNCYFCMSFWACMLLCVAVAFAKKDPLVLFCPIFAAVITRKML